MAELHAWKQAGMGINITETGNQSLRNVGLSLQETSCISNFSQGGNRKGHDVDWVRRGEVEAEAKKSYF